MSIQVTFGSFLWNPSMIEMLGKIVEIRKNRTNFPPMLHYHSTVKTCVISICCLDIFPLRFHRFAESQRMKIDPQNIWSSFHILRSIPQARTKSHSRNHCLTLSVPKCRMNEQFHVQSQLLRLSSQGICRET